MKKQRNILLYTLLAERASYLLIMKTVDLVLSALALLSSVGRDSRAQLLFPDPRGSETKVQVLFGLGLPMEGEVSMTLGYVLKCNYGLPYNGSEAVWRRASGREEAGGASRWTLYRVAEAALGRGCLLRAVCELAAAPFDGLQGLTGQLLRAFLTPSSTKDEYQSYADRQYHAAEREGQTRRHCRRFYSDCPRSQLDLFTFLDR